MTASVKSRANGAVKHAPRTKIDRKTTRGSKIAAIRTGALAVGRTAFSILKFAAAAGLIVATAVGAAAMVPKPMQKRIARDLKHTAALTVNRVAAQARALGV
ncbi:MAG TPA: hypothetical protein VII56_01900 [Rhizomicrobium sp.]